MVTLKVIYSEVSKLICKEQVKRTIVLRVIAYVRRVIVQEREVA
jgi:hypothetical protein